MNSKLSNHLEYQILFTKKGQSQDFIERTLATFGGTGATKTGSILSFFPS